jgi:hypothetical protein
VVHHINKEATRKLSAWGQPDARVSTPFQSIRTCDTWHSYMFQVSVHGQMSLAGKAEKQYLANLITKIKPGEPNSRTECCSQDVTKPSSEIDCCSQSNLLHPTLLHLLRQN